MSKDLERDYKELVTQDAPDLWERIEGQLEPRKTGVKPGRRKRYEVLGMAAAACLCLAVAVPALTGKDAAEKRSGAGAGTQQGDMTADDEAYWNTAAEEEPEEGRYADAAGADDGYSTPAEEIEPMRPEGALPQDAATEDVSSGVDSALTQAPETEAAMDARPQNCTITAAVTDILRQESGTIYLVRVVETAEEGVEKEDRLRFLDPGVLETELAVGGTYEFDVFLPEEGSGGEIWTICACEEK